MVTCRCRGCVCMCGSATSRIYPLQYSFSPFFLVSVLCLSLLCCVSFAVIVRLLWLTLCLCAHHRFSSWASFLPRSPPSLPPSPPLPLSTHAAVFAPPGAPLLLIPSRCLLGLLTSLCVFCSVFSPRPLPSLGPAHFPLFVFPSPSPRVLLLSC